jgi:hypothetical protein
LAAWTPRGTIQRILSYLRSEAEREILLLLARGEKEIAAELGFCLDQVLAEADARPV